MTRREYWVVSMMNSGISSCILGITALVLSCMETSLIGCIDSLLNGDVTKFAVAIVGIILYVYFCIYSGVMNIFNGVKRFHDVGINGWVYLVCMLLSGPGQLAIFIITLLDSKEEVTEYGGVPDESKYKGTKSMLVSSLVFGIGTVFMVVMLFINVMVFGLTGLYEENSSAGVVNAEVEESTTEEETGWGYDEDCISEDIEETIESEWGLDVENNVYYMSLGDNTWSFKVPDTVDSSSVSGSQFSIYYETPEGLAIEYLDSFCTVGEQDPMTDIQGTYGGTPTQVTVAGKEGYIADLSNSELGYYKFVVYVNVGETDYLKIIVASYDDVLTQDDVLDIATNSLQ